MFFNLTGSLLPAVLGSMVVCSLVGVAIERFVYFPLLKYPPFVPLIASIAILLSVEELCRLVAGPQILTFPAELPFPEFHVAGVKVTSTLTAVYCITAAVLGLLWLVTARTELGLAMRAASQDMAVAGILVGIYFNQVYPTMGAIPAYKTLALIVVGGLGSVPGAVVASLVLGMAETLLIGYADIPLPRDALAFIAMIAMLMWRSQGLLGSR
jgi:branched-chain amino acid transport system permease protein